MTENRVNGLKQNQKRLSATGYFIRHSRTRTGFIMRKYNNMRSRILLEHEKRHLYPADGLLSKDEFTAWLGIHYMTFDRLFRAWEESGYERRLSPSVDRIDSSKGYTTDNMELVTNSVNCSRGAKNRRPKNV